MYSGEGMLEQFNKEFHQLASMSLGYDEWALDPATLTSKIRKFYFGDDSLHDVPKQKVIDVS